ncbi:MULTISPECIES: hypothetical protein [Micromonospora]|uniref:hypothetical protein n=1 Tax=Micromonospora TaxID=1873 RepID=UPI001B37402D|nr:MULTISPECIES: hypothetical protein [unclassified Micromonospora]MBQ0979522.1 hypothetical protein [Micromonospora sp. M61]MBQ1035639.1 hypothetical protein [Micromonospora sp. C81]WTI20692.1 hypothetical protein OG886_27880 [Micromonospora zamorensis]
MTQPESQPERQFLELTEGNQGLAKLLHACLTQLRDGVAGSDLQEMARDVLAGHTDLRQIAATDAYGGMLLDHYQRFRTWEQTLDPEERQHMADQAADLTARPEAH